MPLVASLMKETTTLFVFENCQPINIILADIDLMKKYIDDDVCAFVLVGHH
jgi:hypothetical protein